MTVSRQSRTRSGQQGAEERINALKLKGGPFVAAVEATRMPMVVTDPSVVGNPIIYANEAFLELCGYDEEEVLGQNYLFLAAGPHADADPKIADRVRIAMSAREDLVEEMQFYRKDGTPIWVAGFIRAVIEEDRIVQHFASFIDITHRVELERDLSEARQMLERRVAQRTQRLEAANTKLREEVERRTRMEAVLRDTLAQREEDVRYRMTLAREIDHRTKNALQMASTLLQLQAGRTPEPAAAGALLDARNRLIQMADVHSLLYRGDQPCGVDFADYLRRIAHDLGDTLQPTPGQVAVAVDADEAQWGPGTAIPLGLLVGEAITNAMKHAFPGGRPGNIRITLRLVGGGLVRLRVEDDGVGLPPARREGSLGMELIDVFASQIKGKVAIDTAPEVGTRLDITFPDPNGG